MHARAHRPQAVALVAILLLAVFVMAALAPRAGALTLPILTPPPPPAQTVPPVAAPISGDPDVGAARGTMILVHAGGWAGHDAYAQDLLRQSPGELLRARGWRVVSIDYEEGAAGLQDVLNAAGSELSRGTADGPLCVYGESAGAHLALVAASRLRAIDCVIGVGAPTDLLRYEADALTSTEPQVQLVGSRMRQFFGETAEALAPWSPIVLAPSIHADVLLFHEADDPYVPVFHTTSFQAARPTTQTVILAPGDPADPSTKFVHGTVSAEARAQYAATVGSFADRVMAGRDAIRAATRLGCSSVSRTLEETGVKALQRALGCLGRADSVAREGRTGKWRQTTIRVRGEVTPARVWAALRASTAGRRALAAAAKRKVRISVRIADRSRVTLRAAR